MSEGVRSASMSSPPLFSIVVPTRDRPDFVRLVVDSLKAQSFRDFEVIVSDNAVRRRFSPDPATFDGVRFRYVQPPSPVWMCDHWEFAVGHARGRYVGILGDRSLLIPRALASVARVVEESGPDAVSWAYAGYMQGGVDLIGPGVLHAGLGPYGNPVSVTPEEILDYLLAAYSAPGFEANHLVETRGSIYHGVFSSALLEAVRGRFGRVFRFYAPDLNSQCAAMQIARSVVHVQKPLEVRLEGPSNGAAMQRVTHVWATQSEAARAGTSRPLIPGVSASNAHLLLSDLVEISGRPLPADRVMELYRRTAYDLYRAEDWPDRASQRAQLAALYENAAKVDVSLRSVIAAEKWKARRSRLKAKVAARLRDRFGTRIDGLWQRLVGAPATRTKRRFESAYAALAALNRSS
jgi:hypothetical protein